MYAFFIFIGTLQPSQCTKPPQVTTASFSWLIMFENQF